MLDWKKITGQNVTEVDAKVLQRIHDVFSKPEHTVDLIRSVVACGEAFDPPYAIKLCKAIGTKDIKADEFYVTCQKVLNDWPLE